MANATKEKQVKTPVPTPKENDFESRAKMYQTEVELLQRKFSIIQRPLITPYGPDIQLSDAKELPQAPRTAQVAQV